LRTPTSRRFAYVIGERITIDATFVEHLADRGYRNISAEKLVALKNHGFQP